MTGGGGLAHTASSRTSAGPAQTIVMVTHDPVAASYADTVVFFADGRIVDTMPRPDAVKTHHASRRSR